MASKQQPDEVWRTLGEHGSDIATLKREMDRVRDSVDGVRLKLAGYAAAGAVVGAIAAWLLTQYGGALVAALQ